MFEIPRRPRRGRLRLIVAVLTVAVLLPTAQMSLGSAGEGEYSDAAAAAVAEARQAERSLGLGSLDEIREPLLALGAKIRRKVVSVGLQKCIHRALEHNLDIRVGSYGPAIQMTDVVQAEAAFDAVLFGAAQFDVQDRANLDATFFERTIITPGGEDIVRVPQFPFDNTHDYNYSVGLRKRLPTGAVVETAQVLRRYRNLNDDDNQLYLNPFHEFGLQFQVSQPLLRDFGIDINRASINAARNNYRTSQQQFHLLVIQTVAQVEANYWRLVLARQRFNVFRALLREAEVTLQMLTARQLQDTSTEFLSQSKALRARSINGMVAARNNMLDQQHRLLESLNDPNLPIEREWEIIPTDAPTQQKHGFDEPLARRTALHKRPELIAQKLRVDTAGIARGLAENQVLPRLDLVARQEITGAGAAEHSAWDNQWSNDNINYGVGVSFEVPIGNRGPKASLRRTKAEQRQEEARLVELQDQVVTDVRISLDAVTHAHEEILAGTQTAMEELNRLRAYEEQTVGAVGTTPGALDRKIRAQEQLAQALLNLAQTISRYNIALMDAQRAQGTLLQYDNIKLMESND